MKGECSHPFPHFIKSSRGSSFPKGNILQELCGGISCPALALLPKLGHWEKPPRATRSRNVPDGTWWHEATAAWGLVGCPQPLEGCSDPERVPTLTPCMSQLRQADVWVCTLTLLIHAGKQILYMSQRPINVKLPRQTAETSAQSKQGEEGGISPSKHHHGHSAWKREKNSCCLVRKYKNSLAVPLAFPFSHGSAAAAPGFVGLSCHGEAVAARPCWGTALLVPEPREVALGQPQAWLSPCPAASRGISTSPLASKHFLPFQESCGGRGQSCWAATRPMKSLSPPQNSRKNVHTWVPWETPNSAASGCEGAGTVTLQSQGKGTGDGSCPLLTLRAGWGLSTAASTSHRSRVVALAALSRSTNTSHMFLVTRVSAGKALWHPLFLSGSVQR